MLVLWTLARSVCVILSHQTEQIKQNKMNDAAGRTWASWSTWRCASESRCDFTVQCRSSSVRRAPSWSSTASHCRRRQSSPCTSTTRTTTPLSGRIRWWASRLVSSPPSSYLWDVLVEATPWKLSMTTETFTEFNEAINVNLVDSISRHRHVRHITPAFLTVTPSTNQFSVPCTTLLL